MQVRSLQLFCGAMFALEKWKGAGKGGATLIVSFVRLHSEVTPNLLECHAPLSNHQQPTRPNTQYAGGVCCLPDMHCQEGCLCRHTVHNFLQAKRNAPIMRSTAHDIPMRSAWSLLLLFLCREARLLGASGVRPHHVLVVGMRLVHRSQLDLVQLALEAWPSLLQPSNTLRR